MLKVSFDETIDLFLDAGADFSLLILYPDVS